VDEKAESKQSVMTKMEHHDVLLHITKGISKNDFIFVDLDSRECPLLEGIMIEGKISLLTPIIIHG